MGIDWYSCKSCGETFSDCGDFESCECGQHWCCLECAEADGYIYKHCGLYENKNDCESDIKCWECDNQIETSCKYCREEDFEEIELLDFALKVLNKTRQGLIEKYKLSKNT